MSEKTPDEIEGIVYVGEDGEPEPAGEGPVPGREYEREVTPESRDAHLEGKVEHIVVGGPGQGEIHDGTYVPDELPPLTTAAALLGDDPLSSLPVEDADDETPPDPTPLTDKAWGPKGTERRDVRDAMHRERARVAEQEIASHPMVQQATAHDAVRLAQKKAVQEAFIKAQQAKAKS